MKTNIKNLTLPLIVLFSFTACQDEVDTYEGGSGIYLAITSQTAGLLVISFGDYHRDTLSLTFDFRVDVIGNIENYDRPFVFKAIENDTLPARENTDYEILDKNPVIKAGDAFTNVRVKFIRTLELSQNVEKIVRFELEENEYFTFLRPKHYKTSAVGINIKLNEEIYDPWWWDYYGVDRFGTYSKTKSLLICDKMGIPRSDWTEFTGDKMNESYLTFACIYMHRWLEEEKKNGSPVYDELLPGMTEPPLMEMGVMANPK